MCFSSKNWPFVQNNFLKKETLIPTDVIWNHPTIVMQNNKLIYVLPLVVFNVIE